MGPFDESLFDGSGLSSLPPVPVDGYLGRFQLGGRVPLAVTPVDGGGFPTSPDAAPTATIFGTDDAEVAAVRLPMIADELHFGLAYLLGIDLPLGSYRVEYAYSVAGQPGSSTGSFDVIPGGDPGGAVISMAAIDRPLARYIVAQLASGRLVQGRNPRI